MKIKAKQGKLLIISDLNITLTDDTVMTLTDEEYNSSNDIKIFKNDIDFVSDAQAAKAETKKAKVVGEVKPNVTNDSTVVTAGKTTESTPNNVFVANPAPTAETTVETKTDNTTVTASAETAAKTEAKTTETKAAETTKAEEQTVTASEAPATQSKGKRSRPSKK